MPPSATSRVNLRNDGSGARVIPPEQAEQSKLPLSALLGRMMWKMPLPFGVARSLGFRYTLRCVLFHDIADQASEFTNGLRLTVPKRAFENAIRFVKEHYTPVSLSDVLSGLDERKFSRPPVLVTFDDAYRSVALEAAPLLREMGIPAVVFVNASTVGNQDILLDNLISYVANTSGLAVLSSVARDVARRKDLELRSLAQVFGEFLPALPQTAVREFRASLAAAAGVDTPELAREARLFVTLDELRQLVSSGFEVGNHTYSHVCCRSLRGDDFEREILANKSQLERMTGAPVRTFSVPYGSALDLTDELLAHLHRSGHEATFLVDSCSNTPDTNLDRLNRVSVHGRTDSDLFSEVEVLPRLRSIRNRLAARKSKARLRAS